MARRGRGGLSIRPSRVEKFTGEDPCIVLNDYSSATKPLEALKIGVDSGKVDVALPALVDTFLNLNRQLLELYEIKAVPTMTLNGVPKILFETGDVVGACPLVSPVTGKYDLGVVIEPRIGWDGLGPLLTTMGFKVVPDLQDLCSLPRSDREIPSWVIASVVVKRIESLLSDMSRRYETRRENLSSPRGRVDWGEYVTRNFPQMKLVDIPCEYSQLEDNRALMGVIHYTLRFIQSDLMSQLSGGTVVLELIARIEALIRRVGAYPIVQPDSILLQRWLYAGIQSVSLDPALEAMRWTAEGRGLAGRSDLCGLPWKMHMSAFFEAYVETVVRQAVALTGGEVLVGRKNETDMNIRWDTRIGASQKYLLPDILVKRGRQTVVVDAKFKNFKQEMSMQDWMDIPEMSRDEHRNDLLQVLAYTTAFSEMPLSACLVYPVEDGLYDELKGHGILHQHAQISENGRDVDIIITAVPMRGNIDDVAREFAETLIEMHD